MPFQKAFPGRSSATNMTTGSLSREIRGLGSNGLRGNNMNAYHHVNERRVS